MDNDCAQLCHVLARRCACLCYEKRMAGTHIQRRVSTIVLVDAFRGVMRETVGDGIQVDDVAFITSYDN